MPYLTEHIAHTLKTARERKHLSQRALSRKAGAPEPHLKVKRLFMHVAEALNHPWLDSLELSRVDFGSGKRTIHPGGRLDRKYNLVVSLSDTNYG